MHDIKYITNVLNMICKTKTESFIFAIRMKRLQLYSFNVIFNVQKINV